MKSVTRTNVGRRMPAGATALRRVCALVVGASLLSGCNLLVKDKEGNAKLNTALIHIHDPALKEAADKALADYKELKINGLIEGQRKNLNTLLDRYLAAGDRDDLDDELDIYEPYIIGHKWAQVPGINAPSQAVIDRVTNDAAEVEKLVRGDATAKASIEVATIILDTAGQVR